MMSIPFILTCPRWIASLNHEVFDDAVELGVVVISSSAQLCEILAGIWCMIPV